MWCRRCVLAAFMWLVVPGVAVAQHYQTDFPPEEFKARWARVFDAIGPDAAAVLQGVSLTNGYTMPRQHNTFYYLCGIETPGAYLLLDGRTRKVTLYLPPQNAQLERAEGKVLSAADAALVQKLTGVDQVLDSGQMKEDWPGGAAGTPRLAAIYAEFEPAEAQGQSRGELRMGNAAITNDPWDGRLPRESRFVELVRLRNARAEIRNLSPILDDLRAIKSAREIALIRRASQLAGLGLMEAMRSTEAGVYEYQLDAAARYVFLVNDAKLEAYRSITAAGTENINNMHYYRNTKRLEDGDLVLMDYAPDYRYYVSDIGRVWPVNGTYAPWQRELLQFTLDYHKAVMSRVKPGVTPQQILADARAAMEPIVAKTKWSKPAYEAAARAPDRDQRRRAVAHGGHGGARRRQLPQRPEAGPRLLDRSAAARARGEPLPALRGHDRRHRDRLRELHPLHPDGTGCHGGDGEGEGPGAEGAGRTVRRGPARQAALASEDEDQAGGELGLPHDVHVEADDAAASARGAGVDVHERREHPAIEPQTQVPRERELDASTAAEREPDLVVAVGPVVGEPQEPGEERPRTARTEVLTAAGQPVIDDRPGSNRRTERPAGDVDVRLLMREQRLEPEPVRHLDADGAAERRGPVEILRMVRRQLEQVAAEAVAGEGGHLDGLSRCGRSAAHGKQDGECGEHARDAAGTCPIVTTG